MADPTDRFARNVDWYVRTEQGSLMSVEHAQLAVLMDIRRELRRLNAVFSCPDVRGIPRTLQQISQNTTPKKRKPSRKIA
jgi:hypothetical protein